MNYADLSTAIQAYCENNFPDSQGMVSATQIATFVREAEQRIYNNVQILALRKNVTGTTTNGIKYLAVPSDWLANFSLSLTDPVTGAFSFLLNKDVNFIRESFPFPAVTGAPTHYAMFDNTSYILGPTPDNTYTMELHYFYYPPSIVTAGTSWVGDNFDSVLLYGSLLEAAAFMKSDADVITQYQKRYDEALALLTELAEGKNRQDMYRTQQIRFPVR